MVGGQDNQLREEFLTNSKNEKRDDKSQKDDNCKGSSKSNKGDDDSKSKSGSKKWIDNKGDDGSKDNSNQRLNLIRNLNVNTMHLNQSKFPRLYGCNFQFNLFFLINIRRKFNFDHDLISILFFVAHSKQSKIQFNSGLLQCWAYFFLVGCYKSFCILAHLVS